MTAKFYIYEADMPGQQYLEWNPAAQIMETCGDRHYASSWDSKDKAERAAEFYGHVWHATNRGSLKVVRVD